MMDIEHQKTTYIRKIQSINKKETLQKVENETKYKKRGKELRKSVTQKDWKADRNGRRCKMKIERNKHLKK